MSVALILSFNTVEHISSRYVLKGVMIVLFKISYKGR